MGVAKKLSIRLEAVGGDKVRQEFKSIGTDGTKAFRQITNVITPANDNLKVINETAKTFNGVLKQAAGLAGAYLGLRGLTSTFKSIVGVNAEFERLSGSLKTVTGSAKAAKEAFSLIEDFATSTPYQLDEIVDSFIRLKAMGLEPSMEALTSYGNTASAFGKNILEFVSAVTSATVGEFERLKTFGIKAKVEGDTVKFVFQGVTTEVAKNATEIERYLRSIGNINFGGAMAEQMNTMGGTMSNIEDAMAKVARTIGESGLNDAIKGVLEQFNTLISGSNSAAKSIGGALTTAVNVAGKAFFALANNIEPIITLLTVRLGAAAIIKTWTLLKGSVLALNAALLGTGTAGATATLGLRMMWQVSKLAAVQMYATTVAANVLKGALALLGGPAGLVLALAYGLYKLVDSHDVAKRAANDHADTLQKLKDQMAETVKETSTYMNTLSKNQAIAEWSHKLKIAEKNVKDLEKELKNTGGISFFKRHAPNFMLDEYEIFANDLAEILSESKYNLDEYEKKVWELAAEYPDFKPQADAIQEKLLLLKAARQDAWDARKELEYINNPELRPKKELEQQTEQLPTVDTSAYEKNIEDIKKKVFELQEPYDQAMQKAAEWRDNALANLDSTKAGYEDFKADVNRVYDDMVKKASDAALKSSTNWRDGLTRSLQSSYADVTDMAKATENIVKNSFTAMEDTLTEFVMTGKASFSDFVNSIVEGMVRMAIQYAVIKPIMSGIMGYFGVPMAHTGGVIGTDTLSSRQISPDVFEGAPRYHTGGLVGDEIPIIAKRGETVFTKGQMDALGTELNSKNPVNVNVNVHNNASGTKASASANKDAQGNVSIDVIVEQIESTIGKNISKGEGLSPILEQRYALNPAFGSYR
ncbi:MAG: hypothetical protein IKC10_03320 [Alphaproteobacteria bacterium]|nr:hypothetical protein [Alphaproteobacteria bacterium]